MIYRFPLIEQFMAFVVERHRVYERRAAGFPAPWTKDPILQRYRFCNVYRELDRTTQWIARHWRGPHATYEHLWFSMVIARLVNRPETLHRMAFPGRWNKRHFISVLHTQRAAGQKMFGSAYIISTNGQPIDKAEYLAQYVLDPLWERRNLLKPKPHDSLRSYHFRLLDEHGMGSFMAAQVVADLKYVEPLVSADDWWTFAASGPGSRRGMSFLLGYGAGTRWLEFEWREALSELHSLVRPRIKSARMPPIHGQDLQNCLCEWSKYRRTQLGTGRPKQKFTPTVETENARS